MSKSYYLDSSCLVKKYIQEAGTPFIQNLFLESSFFYASFLTYPEIHSSLNRLARTGLLSSNKKEEFLKDLEKDWGGFTVVDYSAIHGLIPVITGRFPLSGADAIQLACAAHLKASGIDPVFLTSDQRLFNAAEDFGLNVFDPVIK